VRQTEDVLEMFQFALVHADFAKTRSVNFAGANASRPLAVEHRNHRDTDVHLGILKAILMRPSCGRRFFGDVEMAQILTRETMAG